MSIGTEGATISEADFHVATDNAADHMEGVDTTGSDSYALRPNFCKK